MTTDTVEGVQRFAKIRKIKYSLLSDPDADVISAFGLFNDHFPESSRYYGTSLPRVVVINADGVVTHAYNGHGYTSDFEIETIVNRAAGLPDPAS